MYYFTFSMHVFNILSSIIIVKHIIFELFLLNNHVIPFHCRYEIYTLQNIIVAINLKRMLIVDKRDIVQELLLFYCSLNVSIKE